MEVKLLPPPVHGCLIALVTLSTLGFWPLLRRMAERHFIRRMDDSGIETRGGRRIAWSEITRVTRTVGKVGMNRVSDEYVVRSSRGKASLPLWRAGNAKEAADYFLRRLPPEVGSR